MDLPEGLTYLVSSLMMWKMESLPKPGAGAGLHQAGIAQAEDRRQGSTGAVSPREDSSLGYEYVPSPTTQPGAGRYAR